MKHSLLALALLPTLLLADEAKDLDQYQASEVLRLENPGALGYQQRSWALQFADEYRRRHGRDPAGPSPARRAAARVKVRAKTRAAAQAARAALGGQDPLAREVSPPEAPTRPLPTLGELAEVLGREGVRAAHDYARADVDWSDSWKPRLGEAVAYWQRAGHAAFRDESYTAAYLAHGFRSGYLGFPRDPAMAEALIQSISSLVKSRTTERGRGVYVPDAIPANPPESVLQWARKRARYVDPSPAQVAADEATRDRDRFYRILEKVAAGEDVPEADRAWARQHEREARGGPSPQWDLAEATGQPLRQAEATRVAGVRAEVAAHRKALDERVGRLGGLLTTEQLGDLLDELERYGTSGHWIAVAERIPVGNMTARVYSGVKEHGGVYWRNQMFYREHPEVKAREEAEAAERARQLRAGSQAPAPGRTRARDAGPSLYDQAGEAQRRFEQYQRDSFNRGGTPNAPGVLR